VKPFGIILAGVVLTCLRAGAAEPDSARAFLDKYCATCHNDKAKIGGLSLSGLDLANAGEHAEVWEKVLRKLRSGTMPPAGLPRPDLASYNQVSSLVEGQLDRVAARHPYAGRASLRRLNRTEYGNSIRDLLALDVDANALLPPDDAAFGFDNISEMLGVSPALEERYLSAAIKVAALAVGDMRQQPGSQTWRLRQDLSQDQHLEGMPLGTVGGTRVRYNFPLDGTYKFQAKLYRTNLNIMRGLQTRQQVEFSLDGKRIQLAALGGPEDLAKLFDNPTDTGDAVDSRLQVKLAVSAGPHTIAVAFLENAESAEPVRLQPFLRSSVDNFDWSGHPHLQVLSVTGPFDATSAGDTPSRQRIFTCKPAARGQEEPCARTIVKTLVARAWREAPEGDVERVMRFYAATRKEFGFEPGIQAALERILASPKFVFRAEKEPAGIAPGSVYRVADTDLAGRLSFFLWSTAPDDRLRQLASEGKLKDKAVLDSEVRRMLADPKSDALVSNFAGQWLQLRNLRNVQPNTDIFPDFDDNLRQAMRRETEMLFASVMKEDRSALDLMNADYTFVNERLALHYGITGIHGNRFQRVTIHDEARRGLLGQGSILALTSHAERTSPVVRGKWVLENLLGLAVSPPPANVPPLKEKQDGEAPRTMREQMVEHRANPVCAACHKTLDPIGFSLENFDAVGAWRDREAGVPVDASGVLADGTKVDGVVALRKAILTRPELFAGTLTEKLLTYALGRGVDYRDMPAVRTVVSHAASGNYRFSDLILGVVHSTPFGMSTAADTGLLEKGL
jgi:cytochrome c551/c552